MAIPTEVWPSSAAVDALNGTIDSSTGLPYIAKGTSPASTPDIAEQYQRRQQRENAVLALGNSFRAVKLSTANRIGAFPGLFRISTTDYSYPGETECTNYTTAATIDGTYYIYATTTSDSGGTGKLVVSAVGWPSDKATFLPVAIVVRAAGVISNITDERGLGVFWAGAAGSGATTGTNSPSFILDEDNTASAEAMTQLRFRRGTTANDVALRHPTGGTKLQVIADEAGGTFGNIEANQLVSKIATGTKPVDVTSTTMCTNLNADNVDGVGITNPPSSIGGVAYADSTTSQDFTAVGTAGDVLTSAGAAVPIWKSLATAGIQALHALLTAISGLGANGLLSRTSGSTVAARTITAGTSIGVTDGDGVAGNPTIAVAGMTQYAVPVGTAAGALATIASGASNTVLVGNTGANPGFRQLVDADISAAAAIALSKLVTGTAGYAVINNGSGIPTFQSIAKLPCLGTPTFVIGAEVSNSKQVLVQLKDIVGGNATGVQLIEIWLSDSNASGFGEITGTAADDIYEDGSGFLMQEVTANKHLRILTDSSGQGVVGIDYVGARTWYLVVSIQGVLFWSGAITFV